MDFFLKRYLPVIFDWTPAFSYMLWPIKWDNLVAKVCLQKKFLTFWTGDKCYFFEISSYTSRPKKKNARNRSLSSRLRVYGNSPRSLAFKEWKSCVYGAQVRRKKSIDSIWGKTEWIRGGGVSLLVRPSQNETGICWDSGDGSRRDVKCGEKNGGREGG